MTEEREIFRTGQHGYNLRRIVIRDGQAIYQRFSAEPPIGWKDSNEYDRQIFVREAYRAGLEDAQTPVEPVRETPPQQPVSRQNNLES